MTYHLLVVQSVSWLLVESLQDKTVYWGPDPWNGKQTLSLRPLLQLCRSHDNPDAINLDVL